MSENESLFTFYPDDCADVSKNLNYFSSNGIRMSNFLPTAVKFNEFGLFRLALPGFPDRIDPDPGSSSSQSSSLISLKEVKIL